MIGTSVMEELRALNHIFYSTTKWYKIFLAEIISDILWNFGTYEQLKNAISSLIDVNSCVALRKSANPIQNQLPSGRKLSRLYF